MILGKLGANINSIELPDDRTLITSSYSLESVSNKSITKRLHKEFKMLDSEPVKYNIDFLILITHPTIEEFNSIRFLDSQIVSFYLHRDSGSYLTGTLSLITKNLNNKNFINQLEIEIKVIDFFQGMSIVFTDPENESDSVETMGTIIIDFDKNVDMSSISSESIKLKELTGIDYQDVGIILEITGNQKRIQIEHTHLKSNTNYSLQLLSSIVSDTGIRLRGDYYLNFKTEERKGLGDLYFVDEAQDSFNLISGFNLDKFLVESPKSAAANIFDYYVSYNPQLFSIVSIMPTNNSIDNNPFGTVEITLTKKIDSQTVSKYSIFFQNMSNMEYVLIDPVVVNDKITFQFDNLSAFTMYKIKIMNTIKDTFGCYLDNSYTYYFTTKNVFNTSETLIYSNSILDGKITSINSSKLEINKQETLGSGWIHNGAQNNNSDFWVVKDLIPFRFISTYPVENKYSCLLSQIVVIVFNKEIDIDVIYSSNCRLLKKSDNSQVQSSIIKGNNYIKITPTNPLEYEQTYIVDIFDVLQSELHASLEFDVNYEFSTIFEMLIPIWFKNAASNTISYLNTISMKSKELTSGLETFNKLSMDNLSNTWIAESVELFKITSVTIDDLILFNTPKDFYIYIYFNSNIDINTVNLEKIYLQRLTPVESDIGITINQISSNYIKIKITNSLTTGEYKLTILDTIYNTDNTKLNQEYSFDFENNNYISEFVYFPFINYQTSILFIDSCNMVDVSSFELNVSGLAVSNYADAYIIVND